MTRGYGKGTAGVEALSGKIPPEGDIKSGPDFAREILGLIGRLFSDFVSADGLTIDYHGLEAADEFRHWKEESEGLVNFDPVSLETRDEKLAFWINIYNMFVIGGAAGLANNGQVKDDKGFFTRSVCRIGDSGYSLDDMENGILRGNARRRRRLPWRQFRKWDARCHLKLELADERVCFTFFRASTVGPPLHFYRAEKIEAQLSAAAAGFINSGGAVLDRDAKILSISGLLKWYAADFGGDQGVMKFIANNFKSTEDAAFLRAHASSLKVDYRRYYRALNIST